MSANLRPGHALICALHTKSTKHPGHFALIECDVVLTTTTRTTKQQPTHHQEQNTNSLVIKNELDAILVCSF